jgi:hypothetical protein
MLSAFVGCFSLLIAQEGKVIHTGLTDYLTWTELLVTSTNYVLIASMALMNDDNMTSKIQRT